MFFIPVAASFIIGALAGRAAASSDKTGGGGGVFRPMVKGVIKVGAAATNQVKSFVAGVKEDLVDVTAEALSEMASEKSAGSEKAVSSKKPAGHKPS
jgi:uncharacterized membrane protein YeaQ/YmgE (transglycosylase-associated protein family)